MSLKNDCLSRHLLVFQTKWIKCNILNRNLHKKFMEIKSNLIYWVKKVVPHKNKDNLPWVQTVILLIRLRIKIYIGIINQLIAMELNQDFLKISLWDNSKRLIWISVKLARHKLFLQNNRFSITKRAHRKAISNNWTRAIMNNLATLIQELHLINKCRLHLINQLYWSVNVWLPHHQKV